MALLTHVECATTKQLLFQSNSISTFFSSVYGQHFFFPVNNSFVYLAPFSLSFPPPPEFQRTLWSFSLICPSELEFKACSGIRCFAFPVRVTENLIR